MISLLHGDHQFSAYIKSSKKVTFLSPCTLTQVCVLGGNECFGKSADVLDEWSLHA